MQVIEKPRARCHPHSLQWMVFCPRACGIGASMDRAYRLWLEGRGLVQPLSLGR